MIVRLSTRKTKRSHSWVSYLILESTLEQSLSITNYTSLEVADKITKTLIKLKSMKKITTASKQYLFQVKTCYLVITLACVITKTKSSFMEMVIKT